MANHTEWLIGNYSPLRAQQHPIPAQSEKIITLHINIVFLLCLHMNMFCVCNYYRKEICLRTRTHSLISVAQLSSAKTKRSFACR